MDSLRWVFQDEGDSEFDDDEDHGQTPTNDSMSGEGGGSSDQRTRPRVDSFDVEALDVPGAHMSKFEGYLKTVKRSQSLGLGGGDDLSWSLSSCPDEFICSILKKIMKDPGVLCSGQEDFWAAWSLGGCPWLRARILGSEAAVFLVVGVFSGQCSGRAVHLGRQEGSCSVPVCAGGNSGAALLRFMPCGCRLVV